MVDSTLAYFAGRKKYQRPQGMLWADNAGTLQSGFYLPDGYEIGQVAPAIVAPELENQFIVLSDDNRSPLDFGTNRIEKRQRMINGRMRSFHIADKLTLSTSWNMLPSRSYASDPLFGEYTGISPLKGNNSLEYTTDGGAGGNEILDWYENHTGSFWVYLAYDKYKNFDPSNYEEGGDESEYTQLAKYNQVLEMFIADFSYSVEKRGATNHDFWNISVTLEEV